jgi:DNA polymerase elongation subunit (family B)
MPYLYIRMKKKLGPQVAKCLSPIGTAYMNTHSKKLTIAGISVLDYLLLYKKFSGKNEPSYALGPIGKKVVGMDKIQYDGNLNDLYADDIEKFLEYNLNDVKIVVALDEKLKFISLAQRICHVGHVSYENFHMSSRYLEGAVLMYLRRNGGRVAPNKPINGREEYEDKESEGEEGFTGAFVKEPVPGRYNWVFDLDLTSMYPNIIISLNISPETKVSKIADFDMDKHIRGQYDSYQLGGAEYTSEEFSKLIVDNKFSLASNGVLYKTDKKGVIPEILSKWFQERKDMRTKAKQCRIDGDMEGYNFNNQRQQVWKILLNSMYGVLGLPIFRFYDVDNAEAVTKTGVTIIQTTALTINSYYKNELGQDGDWVIYTDTDSCFVDAIPMIKKRFPTVNFADDVVMTEAIMNVTSDVQKFVNEFYNVMAKRMFNLDTHDFDAKQEVISKTSLWLAKKRYAQWIIHKEGLLLEEPELEVKGIDVVRTSFPMSFRGFMKKFLKDLLTGVDKEKLDEDLLSFREKVQTLDVIEIAKNTSVKFVSERGDTNYNPATRKMFSFVPSSPAQVKACLGYNDLLKSWKLDKAVEPIHHGQKIKWVYLKNNEYGLDCIAMKADGNDPQQILDFINTYVDRIAMFEKELQSKLTNKKKEGIYDVLKWTFPNSSMKVAEQFFDF